MGPPVLRFGTAWPWACLPVDGRLVVGVLGDPPGEVEPFQGQFDGGGALPVVFRAQVFQPTRS